MFNKVSVITVTLLMLLPLLFTPVQGNTDPPVTESEERGIPVEGMFEVFDETGLEEKMPAVAYNSTLNQYLVVWYNDRPGNDDIRAQRLSADGKPIGAAFYISAGTGHDRILPDVAYNSTDNQYLVVWQDYYNEAFIPTYSIYGRRVAGDGVVMDSTDIIIRPNSLAYEAMTPRVDYASTSNKYLVVWSEYETYPDRKDVVGQVVEPGGELNGTSFIISDDAGEDFREYPDLAYNRHANRYLVVWQQWNNSTSQSDIFGQQVHGGGGLYLTPITIGYHTVDEVLPRVAAIPTTPIDTKFMVVWETHYSPSDYDIYLRPIEEEGGVGPVKLFAATNNIECNPNVIGSEIGNKFLVTWQETMPRGTSWDWGTVGQEVDYNGIKSGITATIGTYKSLDAALAAGPAGDFLVVFKQVFLVEEGIWGELWGYRSYLPMIIR